MSWVLPGEHLLGLIFAVIAFFGYTTDTSQPSEFYWVCWGFFNSFISGLVCLIMAVNYPPDDY